MAGRGRGLPSNQGHPSGPGVGLGGQGVGGAAEADGQGDGVGQARLARRLLCPHRERGQDQGGSG